MKSIFLVVLHKNNASSIEKAFTKYISAVKYIDDRNSYTIEEVNYE